MIKFRPHKINSGKVVLIWSAVLHFLPALILSFAGAVDFLYTAAMCTPHTVTEGCVDVHVPQPNWVWLTEITLSGKSRLGADSLRCLKVYLAQPHGWCPVSSDVMGLIWWLSCSGFEGQVSPYYTIEKTEKVLVWLRGRASIMLKEGHWFDSPVLHVKVSLGKILNPKLLLMCWLAPCKAARAISVWKYHWITVSCFGQNVW